MSHEALRPIAERDRTRLEVGPKDLHWVPLQGITMLPQQRVSYRGDQLEDLENALTRIDDDGVMHIELIHPPTLNVFDDQAAARQYVRDLNECFELEHPVDAIKPYPNPESQTYIALIAGHRRIHAITELVNKQERSPDKVDVACSVKYGHDFASAIDLQYRENEHRRLTPWQDARAVVTRYKIGVKRGEFSSFSECARKMGISPERVSHAYKFDQLPQFIKDEIKEDNQARLSYGKAVLLYPVAVEHVKYLHEEYLATAGLSDDELELARSEMDKASLAELEPYLSESGRERYEFQMRLARRKIAKTSKEGASVVAEGLVNDIRDAKRDVMQHPELMSARDRARLLRQIKRDRTETYHALADVLLQLRDDADIIAELNEHVGESSSDRIQQIVHTPAARRAINEIVSLLVDIDQEVPDELFRRRLDHSIGEIVMGLQGLPGDTVLPNQIHAVAYNGGQQTLSIS